ncbi:Sec-independent protein translocase subunit TatA/TatB [Hippea maritima]|uniref:Sec-independent translocation protein mttA/Hcf106 n=1 Tax=Hippea maritima (strain ATCC 700847 / DSM 10411 / MH2) TaxID=760142 RepID=F2LUZ4_HIPMA|nr:twin-arginine translocase TatA/TatE family subunit [Hippea maritima]AEA33578.1 sec-independent translocation protein mttA/Hcf106 [Hippea maritima DSM 10411]
MIGTPELIVIAVIALFIVGPKRLPEILRGMAYLYKNITKAMDELKKELEEDLEEINEVNPKKQIEKKWEEFLKDEEEDKKRPK